MAVSEIAQALLSQALKELGDDNLAAAETTLQQLQRTGERHDAVHYNLGVIAMRRGQPELAAQEIELALSLNPRFARAQSNLASVYLIQQRHDDALRCCAEALAINPNDDKAHYNKGVALRRLLRPAEAVESMRMAIRIDLSNPEYVAGLASAYHDLNRHHDALAFFNRAVALDPCNLELRFNRSAVLLQLGHFAQGFEDYELRWFYGGNPKRLTEHNRPRWANQFKLEGMTILLQVEQGLGDNIQFARYASLLAARGARVILQVRPELAALFQGFPDVVAVVAEGDELPPFDCFVPAMSLPLLLGTRLETVPAVPRYLAAPADRIARWRPEFVGDGRLRIGITWSGNPRHSNDARRSIPLSSFPIPNPSIFDVHALQQQVRPADKEILDRLAIRQYGPLLADMADTAAIAEHLDLVICVDTSVAHLAAALGRPVWLLLPTSADWRWLHERTDSPWYPTMRIFQQATPGDWKGVFDQVTAALADVLAQHRGRHVA